MDESWKIDLETKVAHTEMALEILQETVFEHQKTIDKLAAKVEKLSQLLTAANGEGLGIGPGDEKPPHY